MLRLSHVIAEYSFYVILSILKCIIFNFAKTVDGSVSAIGSRGGGLQKQFHDPLAPLMRTLIAKKRNVMMELRFYRTKMSRWMGKLKSWNR